MAMKPRYAEWANLTAGVKPKSNAVPIRIRDIPGIRDLETKLLLYYPGEGDLPLGLDVMVDKMSRSLFGITYGDTLFRFPKGYDDLHTFSDERQTIDWRFHQHEDQFVTPDLDGDETVEVLKTLGLDFGDERGFPLHCTRHLKRQAEAAARGVMGKMPDRQELGIEQWANSLEEQAKTFLAKKKRPTA